MKILDESNIITSELDNLNIDENNILKKEINLKNNDKILSKILKKESSSNLSVGILLKINNMFYGLNNDLSIIYDKEMICNRKTEINIEDLNLKGIIYCNNNINDIEITISIPSNSFDIYCYERCLFCDKIGTQSSQNCLKCNNSKEYYFIENDESGNCFSKNEADGFYLDILENVFKECDNKCITCFDVGSNDRSNCYICNNFENFHFDILIPNHCVKKGDIKFTNIYLDLNEDKFKFCNESCSSCEGPSNKDCLSCDNINGYYSKEDDSKICLSKDNIEIGYFLDEEAKIFKKCHERCLDCNLGGTNSFSNCLKCNNTKEYHFSPNIENHCINYDELPSTNYYLDIDDDKYKLCHDSCQKCDGPYNNSCLTCKNSEGYYFKENDNSKICFTINNIEAGYYLDDINNLFKKCNRRCFTCNIQGTESLSNCIKCNNNDNYHFSPNQQNHCLKFNELPNTNYYLDIDEDKYKLCHESCLKCDGPNNNDCLACYNSKGYYFKENDTSKICFTNNITEIGYYLDDNNNIFKKCNQRCLTCNIGGNDSFSNCEKCNDIDNYHFDPNKTKHCLQFNELPNINYYLDEILNKYKLCHESCLECKGPNDNDCLTCYNSKGYYFKEIDDSSICFSKNNIDIGYYLDESNNIFRKCNNRCLTCNIGGSDTGSNCLKCNNTKDLHFDPIKINHCINYDELININYYLDINEDKYKICHESCLTCNGPSNNNCLICNNSKGYYFKENDNSHICFTNDSIEIGYYLNISDNLFKKCNSRCLSCSIGGIDSLSNCIKCKNENNYHFDPLKQNHCIQFNELQSSNYFLDSNDDKYILCHISCLSCYGPNNDNCLSCDGNTFFETENFPKRCLEKSEIPINYYSINSSGILKYYKCHERCKTCTNGGKYDCQKCNIEGGYFPVEDKYGFCLTIEELPDKYYFDYINKNMFRCHENCESCLNGFNNITQEMNCNTCIEGTYFQNISSTNCIEKPENGYYIDLNNGKKTLFPCYKSCLTCDRAGNSDNNLCLSCRNNYYFDDEIATNCIDDDNECGLGCAKCYKNKTSSEYGILSADKICKRCSHKVGYYPLEKYSEDQFYVSCYPYNKSPKYYIFNEEEKVHKLCYKTCETCFKVGNIYNHSCITCDSNYIFIDEEPNNCFPLCPHYYYYNKYNQYRCTESDECPLEYPYLILNKTKCVQNCYKDDEFNLMFKNECLQKCPEGTSAYLYIYNGEITAKCVDSKEFLDENECKLIIKNNNNLEYDKITEDILMQYAEEYVHDYPVTNKYVTSYYSSSGSLNKYLIVIYKIEKCPKEKVEGYISIGLEECIDKIKTKNIIIQNIVVEIMYIIRKNAPPQITYYLYHPDTGEKLDLSICSGAKLAIKTSIFDNGKVNEKLVKYFSNLKINIFDINDPFFTDICFNFAKDEKDVPLDDRIELYYQNVSLCEDGCVYMGINLETYEVECSCDVQITQTNNNNGDIAKSFLDNPLSNEVFGVITKSNIEVLKCIKKAFNKNLIFKNYGGLMMVGILIVQIVATIFINIQIKQVRNYIYSLILNLKFPPKRKMSLVKFTNLKNFDNNTIDTINRQTKDNNNIYNSSSNVMNENNKLNDKDKQINNQINNKDFKVKKNKNGIKYKLVKQSSLNSITSFNGKKGKNLYVKKGSIAHSTQYTNFTGKPINNKYSSNDFNNNIININKSNGNASRNDGSFERGKVIRINSGGSDTALNCLCEIGEQSNDEYEYDEFNENDDNNHENGININNNNYNVRNIERCAMKSESNKRKSGSNNKSYFGEKKNIYIIQNEDIYYNQNEHKNEIENGIKKKDNKKDNKKEKKKEDTKGKAKEKAKEKEKIKAKEKAKEKKKDDIPINKIILDKEDKTIIVFKKKDNNHKDKTKLNIKNNNLRKRNGKLKIGKVFDIHQGYNTSYSSKNKLDKKEEIKNLKKELRKEIISEIKDREKSKKRLEKKRKQIMVFYEHKEYNDDEINELDYEEAIIYDKRNYCKIFWYTLKEKQTIINTFFVKDSLKPFSIKLLVIIFSFSCYFVINGFLYNEEYVSIKLKSEGSKTFYEYLSDSIERILYTSIVGGVISFIIGILFNTGKKIDNVIIKNKNNKILLKGEIAKIYRCNNIIILFFIIFQFILMILFTIYIFCFCYVYPNNKLDWFESSLLVIGIMQTFSLFNSFLISIIKYLSIKFQWELCFKINSYLDDNL